MYTSEPSTGTLWTHHSKPHLRDFEALCTGLGICSFAYLLIPPLLFCSKSIILKCDSKQLVHITLYYCKEQRWSICSCRFLQKRDLSKWLSSNCSHHCSLIRSFLKSNLSDSLPSLFTKERPWGSRSSCLRQKSDVAICSFSRAKCSFSLSLTKHKQIARKTDEWISNLAYLCTKLLSRHLNSLRKLCYLFFH